MTYRGMLPFFPANLLLHHNSNELQRPHVDAGVEMDQGKKRAASPLSRAEGSEAALSVEEASLSDTGLAAAVAAAAGERKKRLSAEQIRVLEKSFEMGRKLEPERKAELAGTLGLPPRQVAIWFQNRRARWKTKQTEEEFDELKRQLAAIRQENAELQAENKRLLAEVNEIRPIELSATRSSSSTSIQPLPSFLPSFIFQLLALKGKETAACEPINLNKEAQAYCGRSSATTGPELLFGGLGGPSRREDGGGGSGLCSMLDEQSAFWVWPEQSKFHPH